MEFNISKSYYKRLQNQVYRPFHERARKYRADSCNIQRATVKLRHISLCGDFAISLLLRGGLTTIAVIPCKH